MSRIIESEGYLWDALPTDDYGTIIIQFSAMSWVYSTCTYGGFGEGTANDMRQDV